MSDKPNFCVGPRDDGLSGICGHKLKCPSITHKKQRKFLKAYPKVMDGVCSTKRSGAGSPGICGIVDCQKHPIKRVPRPKQTFIERSSMKNKRPRSEMVHTASPGFTVEQPPSKKPKLQHQNAFSGVQNLIMTYKIEIAEARQQIIALDEKIKMREADIASLLKLA